VWHGLLNPGFEPTSPREMARHLVTVHLPLYAGVVGLFASLVVVVIRRRATAERVLWVALAGAGLQLAGEGWHAWTHLALAPDPVVPGIVGAAGFAIALVGLGLAWHRRRRATR
jgi:hypothetical protein